MNSNKANHKITSRAKHNSLLRNFAISMLDKLMLRGVVASWSYRCGLQGRLSITSVEILIANTKHLRTPLVMAFASDFHAGPTTHPAIFTDFVTALEAINPNLLLLGGDFVSCNAHYIDSFLEIISQSSVTHGKYAVLGNHDLWTNEQYIMERLKHHGIRTLVNEQVQLSAPFEDVSICGIDDPWTGYPDVQQAFKDARPIRIFLTHSPDGLLFVKDKTFDVGFSGHTHGGQIALPNGTPLIAGSGPLSRRYSRGNFNLPAGRLIVSRGIGCSNLPVRINSEPELVICKLYSPSP